MFKERLAERACPDARRDAGESRLLDALARPNDADLDEFRRGIDPLAASGKLGALLAQFPAELQGHAGLARLPRRPAARVRRLPGRRRTASSELERPDRRDAGAAERLRRRVGADRRAEVPLLDPAELPAERPGLLLHAPARPERGEVVAAREVGRPLRLPLLGRRAEGVLRHGRRRAGGWSRSCTSTRTITSRRSRWPTPR